LDPYYVMLSSTPLTAQLKINLTLTISIAFERVLALFFPLRYRRLPSSKYAMYCLLIGCLLAAVDLAVEFTFSPFKRSPNCAAIGCFISPKFSYYWGTSNMVMGFVIIVLTALLIIKLRIIERESQSKRVIANRTSAGILMTSLVFVTIPSVGVGLVEMLGYSIFKTVGPFYIVGLLCAGSCNSIVYVVLNRDMRDLAKTCIFHMPSPTRTSMLSERVFSTSRFYNHNNR
ncbi:hypothetical protein TELCIR_22232, partial [Teladorsagia circumcincta]